MNTDLSQTYNEYLSSGFIPLLCKGFHLQFNRDKIYDLAKQPAFTGWNNPEYLPPSLEEIGHWEDAGGWVGWRPLLGIIILDVDNGQDDVDGVGAICRTKGIEPGIHKSNNGYHFFFRASQDLKGSSQVFTQAGIMVTYRVSNNYVILAPTNKRLWVKWIKPEELPSLPDELLQYNPQVLPDVLNCLSWHLGKACRAGQLSGYEDLDAAYACLLIQCEISPEEFHRSFKLIFQADYNQRRTEEMYRRTRERMERGEPVIGAGSFFQRLKDAGLEKVLRFARELQAVKGRKEEAPKNNKPGGLRVVTVEEMLEIEFKPRESILSPWLHTQGLSMIHASRGVGKTLVSIGMAVAISSGGEFLGWSAPIPRSVLYIDGEMPGVVLKERIAMAILGSSTEPVAPLKIITPDLQETGMPDLSSEEGQEAIEPFLEDISLVIVDNISTLCRTGRENEGESWLPLQEWGLRLRSQGRSLALIHHDGKGGQQRGTSRREDVLDTVIHLKHPGDYRPEQGARFEVHFEKARMIYGDDVKAFEAQLIVDSAGNQEWTIKTMEESLTDRVADLLNDGVPQKEIHELLGVSKGTVSKHKSKAQTLRMLKK